MTIGISSVGKVERMEKNDLLTIKEFAELAGVTRQTVYKQLNNRLNPYCQLVDNKKMLELRALEEVYGVSVDKPCQPKRMTTLSTVLSTWMTAMKSYS